MSNDLLATVKNKIDAVQYHKFPGTMTHTCCVTLASGFSVVGEAHCADAEEYNADLGNQYAYEDALTKAISHEVYHQKETAADE